jgi:dCTP deaminase
MILNEVQILERLLDIDPDKRIIVSPLIHPEEQFGPSSLDVRLGTDFYVLKRSNVTHFDVMNDPEHLQKEMSRAMDYVKASATEPFVLHPGEFALASTLEFLRIPLDLAVRLEGRSTWGRLGLQIHATAGFVDPGFCGALTFELSNVSTVPIQLYPGVRIGQLCFFQGVETRLPYNQKKLSKYSGKLSTAASAFYRDPEYARLREQQLL